jgi:transcriptional regulator of heat shock response
MPISSDQRRRDVLQAVIREYLRSGEPVGSASLCERYDLGVSAATVRGDLADLVEEGFLVQPHTSAGRVPTAGGYRLYVDEFIREAALAARQQEAIIQALKAFELQRERAAKAFARMVAEMTGETVVMRYGDAGDTLVAGLANLANKPESRLGTILTEISRAIDEIEETMAEVRRRLNRDVAVLIGPDNPFGDDLAGVFTELAVPGVGDTTIGVVGPQRMDYDKNVALVRFLKAQEAVGPRRLGSGPDGG